VLKIKTIKKHNFFINFIKWVIRKIRKLPLIIKQDDLPEKAIYIANHNGASGPMNIITFFPKIVVPWGAYQMTQGYFSRWKYLYHTFYRNKLGYSIIRSFLLATFFGLVSRILYRGVKLIASYPDIRLRETITYSILHLENNNSILVFPEDSSSGYKDENSFHEGFIYLAKAYEKKHGSPIPVVPVYYHKEKHVIAIGKPYRLNQEKTRQDVANDFRVILNDLVNQISA